MGLNHRNGRPGSYYAVLGVCPDASLAEIRTAFRRLAMKWHPDRCGKEPWLADEAKRRFQQIQEAYQVLSDEKKRTLYDAGFYDPFQCEEEEEEEVEGFSEFVQEMMRLMADVGREEKQYTMEELEQMLAEMAQNFDSPPPSGSTQWMSPGGTRTSKRFRCNPDQGSTRRSCVQLPEMQVFGGLGYC